MSAASDPVEAAAEAGLRYVSDEEPGFRRRRRGKGFSYLDAAGTAVTNPDHRARITALAIPPAWTDVWICPRADGHIQATGRDAKNRKQYRYHDRWREVRDADKFDQLAAFGAGLPRLRRALEVDLDRDGLPREKVLALVVRLLDETMIRIGNDAYAADNESYGLTTLLPEHVDVDGERVVFDFVGKAGLAHEIRLHDREVARLVHQVSELGGQELFAYQSNGQTVDVTSTDVNQYLAETAGPGITAKDFRTWGGTVVATAALGLGTPPEDEAAAEKAVLAAYDVAAQVLGNTRAVCRDCYVHPVVPDSYRTGRLHEAQRRARRTAELSRTERTVLKLLDA
ncbi:MAG: topoisomerase [Acidimicrobiales bacterium]|nr:topoisomerase [Acidimicrobiales bacterium]